MLTDPEARLRGAVMLIAARIIGEDKPLTARTDATTHLLALAGLEQSPDVICRSRAYRIMGRSRAHPLTRRALTRSGFTAAMVARCVADIDREIDKTTLHVRRRWTSAANAQLRARVETDNAPRADIAAELGISVDALNAQCRALGIGGRGVRRKRPVQAEYRLRQPASALGDIQAPGECDLAPIPGADLSYAKPWLQREAGQCAWPVSGHGIGVWSCCAPVAPEGKGVYCAVHDAARRLKPQSSDDYAAAAPSASAVS